MFKPGSVRFRKRCVAERSDCIHTQVNRMELNTQRQQRDSDSVDSHKATHLRVDDQYREIEEGYFILMEVHLMQQPP
jgi:hypothetical protein